MIGYVTLGTDDIGRLRTYFDALLGTIGAKRLMEMGEEEGGFTMYGVAMDQPAIAIMRPYNGAAAEVGNGHMIALAMETKAQIDAFHATALTLGGSDEGAPGYRGDPAFGFYAGYFRDPDGHKFAAFCMAPEGA